jgi:hypothetical protein
MNSFNRERIQYMEKGMICESLVMGMFWVLGMGFLLQMLHGVGLVPLANFPREACILLGLLLEEHMLKRIKIMHNGMVVRITVVGWKA